MERGVARRQREHPFIGRELNPGPQPSDMIAAPRDHTSRALAARDLDPFANGLLGADGTEAAATVHDRCGMARAFDGELASTTIEPSATNPRYSGIRITPCESCPIRLLVTSDPTVARAWSAPPPPQ